MSAAEGPVGDINNGLCFNNAMLVHQNKCVPIPAKSGGGHGLPKVEEDTTYQTQPSASPNRSFTASVHLKKSSTTITSSFGSWRVSSRRESAITDVMAGWDRAWRRTSAPMKPVAPVTIIFIFMLGYESLGGCVSMEDVVGVWREEERREER